VGGYDRPIGGEGSLQVCNDPFEPLASLNQLGLVDCGDFPPWKSEEGRLLNQLLACFARAYSICKVVKIAVMHFCL
jgi:hypothetical protein